MKRTLRWWLCFTAVVCFHTVQAQLYNASHVFAHNDYAGSSPFFGAYKLGVGYIEADVFLDNGQILVAHHRHEIDVNKSLDALYLKPLSREIGSNKGYIYKNPARSLTLMIDLKSEGATTLRAVVNELERYPEIITAHGFHVLISGNVPDPASWNDYPTFIYFDGRPGISYTPGQLKRISMISTNFREHVKWDGKEKLTGEAREKITALIQDVHSKGKKIRFWATPDFEHAWRQLMSLPVDVIVTDNVPELVAFLNTGR